MEAARLIESIDLCVDDARVLGERVDGLAGSTIDSDIARRLEYAAARLREGYGALYGAQARVRGEPVADAGQGQ